VKVAVLGAGVVGVAAAWYLRQAGHDVQVLDRRDGPGLETSFANGGQISADHAAPWAKPGVPLQALKWMLQEDAPLLFRPRADPAQWRWALQFLRNCTAARYALNKSRMVPLAEYSRDCLRALRADTGIRYDERAQGTLQLFRTQKQLDGTAKDIEVLRQYGVAFEVLDRDGFVRVEPGLRHTQHKFVGALRLPGDETGDCHVFTQRLAATLDKLQRPGAESAARASARDWWDGLVRLYQGRGVDFSVEDLGEGAEVPRALFDSVADNLLQNALAKQKRQPGVHVRATLSGGEGQRIRLATQIGSNLTGVLYVLDEPSIGLHQRDNRRLLDTLVRLRDLGNTVLVVEHDEETIRMADRLIDMGPGAGVHGGEVIAEGTPDEVQRNPRSLTGKYLSGELSIAVPARRTSPSSSRRTTRSASC